MLLESKEERTFQKEGMVGIVKYVLSNVNWTETTGFWKKELVVSWQEQFYQSGEGKMQVVVGEGQGQRAEAVRPQKFGSKREGRKEVMAGSG